MKAYEVVVDRILGLLESGTIPWQRPWDPAVGLPRNIRGTAYRGINLLVLGCQGYESPLWLTARQANRLGGHIRRGERGTPVIFWKWIQPAGERNSEQPQRQQAPLVRYYRVWNLLQTDGLEVPSAATAAAPEQVEDSADSAVSRMPAPPSIRHDGGARAFYRPSTDSIHLPPRGAFHQREGYLATLFHELVHSTGHSSRLARSAVTDGTLFGDHAYSEEELVAETGAAFLCAHVGISNRTIDNAAAYIASWLRVLSGRSPHGASRFAASAAGRGLHPRPGHRDGAPRGASRVTARPHPFGASLRHSRSHLVVVRYSSGVPEAERPPLPRHPGGPMIVAEFLFVACIVGVLTKTWLAFFGTFVGLYALYRFTRLSGVLALALSLYWGLLGYHLGASTGEIGVGPLLAVVGFFAGAWVHRDGFASRVPAPNLHDMPPLEDGAVAHHGASQPSARAFPSAANGEIIDVDYRVVS